MSASSRSRSSKYVALPLRLRSRYLTQKSFSFIFEGTSLRNARRTAGCSLNTWWISAESSLKSTTACSAELTPPPVAAADLAAATNDALGKPFVTRCAAMAAFSRACLVSQNSYSVTYSGTSRACRAASSASPSSTAFRAASFSGVTASGVSSSQNRSDSSCDANCSTNGPREVFMRATGRFLFRCTPEISDRGITHRRADEDEGAEDPGAEAAAAGSHVTRAESIVTEPGSAEG
mmetsp:Transcript_4886/g.12178  ORF Transcript_4886/g.12178 Transcript_4886/m.12178 type:complete len:235 (-) Transcript_4886:88-792(-)